MHSLPIANGPHQIGTYVHVIIIQSSWFALGLTPRVVYSMGLGKCMTCIRHCGVLKVELILNNVGVMGANPSPPRAEENQHRTLDSMKT